MWARISTFNLTIGSIDGENTVNPKKDFNHSVNKNRNNNVLATP